MWNSTDTRGFGRCLEVYHTYGWRSDEVLSMRVRHVDFVAGVIRLDVGTTKNKEGREGTHDHKGP